MLIAALSAVEFATGVSPASPYGRPGFDPGCVYFSFSPRKLMAMPRGIEPRSPERQSGIITAIRWHHIAPFGAEY